MRDPYLYPNSEVLINLADIHDEQILRDMESDFVSWRLSEVASGRDLKEYNFETLCGLHQRIFQDIFEWAGKPRIINIEKVELALGGISIEYSDCFDILKDADIVLREMNLYNWEEVGFEKIVEAFSSFMANLWKVHPFREGNTRTVVIFCSMFIESRGIYIESDIFKDNAAYMRSALVAASAVFHDLGDRRKPEYLYRIVRDALEQGQEMKKEVIEQIQMAGIEVNEDNIRQVVLWNRRTHTKHIERD